jgi:hypothetical protein
VSHKGDEVRDESSLSVPDLESCEFKVEIFDRRYSKNSEEFISPALGDSNGLMNLGWEIDQVLWVVIEGIAIEVVDFRLSSLASQASFEGMLSAAVEEGDYLMERDEPTVIGSMEFKKPQRPKFIFEAFIRFQV